MEQLTTEGVIVSATPFQENNRIIGLFTPLHGLIKIVVKGAFSKKMGMGASTSPLAHIEANCSRGKSDLYSCGDLTVINSHPKLRQNLLSLEAACDIAQAITATQQPESPSPELYQLLLAYLARLSTAENPRAIAASFHLKTLRFEGLLEVATQSDERFSSEERALINLLAYSRNFDEIAAQPVDSERNRQIKSYFLNAIRSF